MSENVDLDSNNLCIPEDAFEQFQAVSMYQEEKLITLTELGLEKPKDPDAGEFSHLSFDNEVVVTTDENEVNSTVNDNSELLEPPEQQPLDSSNLDTSVKVDNSLINSDQNSLEILPLKVSRKGRKKKSNTSKIATKNKDDNLNSLDTVNDIDISVEEPSITSTSVPRKRGRKPKPKPSLPTEQLSTNNHEVSSLSITPFSSDPENSDAASTVLRRRRGRPRKYLNDKELSSEFSGSENNLTTKLGTPRKRGRPRKASIEYNLDINVEKLWRPNSANDHSSLKNNSEVDLNETHPVDSLQEEIDPIELELQKLEQEPDNSLNLDSDKIISNTSLSQNDDMDNMSLSKLKQLPDLSKSDDNCLNEIEKRNDSENCSSEYTNLDTIPLENKKKIRSKKHQRGRAKRKPLVTSNKSDPIVEPVPPNNTEKDDDDMDDLSLSKLKEKKDDTLTEKSLILTPEVATEVVTDIVTSEHTETKIDNVENSNKEVSDTPTKRNTKMPIMSDFEYNIDSVVSHEAPVEDSNADNSLLVEDTSKRPIRRKVATLHYEEESDEDPFANVELSDDDEPRRKKRYYSDDEYVPGRRGNKDIDSTDSEADVLIKEDRRHKRNSRKKSDTHSPRKKVKKEEPDKDAESDVIEITIEPSTESMKTEDDSKPSAAWGSSNEFENFLAKKIQGTNLQIKKVSSAEPTQNKALEIPVIDPEAKKTYEKSSQTNIVHKNNAGVQTSTPYDIPMKKNISLTPEQSEKACLFLNSIVKTTSELGTLMTQKSEDFIKKKINTTHVTDTTKMDYCVKKSFLLFKLAKHNLQQMEEDLAKQYDEFLKTNKLSECREVPKQILPKAKRYSSDSDCEIVEEPVKTQTQPKKSQDKDKFNLKTVFLNKELSIKIAKKPTDNKKLDIKGRHTVWINDTVMVKKVKPTQSFLAQDSRNKKPPDNKPKITTDMVSDFFKNYYHQRASIVCAPFVSTDWLEVSKECVCNYFVVKPIAGPNNVNHSENGEISLDSSASNVSVSDTNLDLNAMKNIANNTTVTCPEPLFKLCFRIVKNQIRHLNNDRQVNRIVTCPEPLFKLCIPIVKNKICDFNDENNVCQLEQNEITDGKEEPVTLFRLCLRALTGRLVNNMERSPTPLENLPSDDASQNTVLPLTTLCHRRILDLLSDSNQMESGEEQESVSKTRCSTGKFNDFYTTSTSKYITPSTNIRNEIKSLLSLCVESIQKQQLLESNEHCTLIPKRLRSLAFEHVKQLLHGGLKDQLFETSQLNSNHHDDRVLIEGVTINSINTLSEEAFLNLEQSEDGQDEYEDFDNDESYEHDYNDLEDDNQTEPSWVSQVQMKELRSCINTNLDVDQTPNIPTIAQIKLEPLDEVPENMPSPSHVKSEPGPGLDEMTIIPDVKPELPEDVVPQTIQRQNSSNYDVDAFEQFVSCNKLLHGLTEDIFSQSAARIRRQHEPDYHEEYDPNMSLLIPQTYEPLTIETAKGSLMESSSDEESSKTKKAAGKRKPDKRKGKQKKPDPKTANKDLPTPTTPAKEKVAVTNNEVATLTRKMRDKIRQEEKKDHSSDSESENLNLRLRNRKEIDKSKPAPTNKTKENEIQCNNVDSTDLVDDDDVANFTGFTAIDQNEISTYQKYMQFVYDKIIPDNEENAEINTAARENKDNDVPEKPIIDHEEPVELLECEPTMPYFDDVVSERRSTRRSKGKVEIPKKDKTTKEEPLKKEEPTKKEPMKKEDTSKKEPMKKEDTSKQEPMKKEDTSKKEPMKKEDTSKKEPMKKEDTSKKEPMKKEDASKKEDTSKKEEISKEESTKKEKISKEATSFIDRHGWHCYPVNTEDSKLLLSTYIALEKLPESFVQTYFEYQGITRKDETDQEIDRLTNLNSLNRTAQMKDIKSRIKPKKEDKSDRTSGKSSEAGSRADSPTFSDHYELEPSDDEGNRVEDQAAPPVAQKQSENNLAKNLLMDDNESDADEPTAKIKEEPLDNTSTTKKKCKPSIRPKHKEVAVEDSPELMLTADKMMNKELNLLHAPIVLNDDVKDTPSKGPVTRNKQKSSSKHQASGSKTKNDEEYSSEEEKQWVTTKEKLLKRLTKKEDASVDDAKRAKLVSEFIERRREAEFPESHKRSRARSRRSAKKFLERQKQLRVLSRELFGEPSESKRSQKAQSMLYKGRRNIRKVIDKKSLARSTVVANMEEFERKRRLNARQTKLRELLGCEEGVNVLVINDEVCLEYDFEENRPVVTVHPFFTKVMKAHQYEGVKFMWDACFEGLAEIESGHQGGGCILAHCMGLGKTLQVLALLHTVLTHPRVGMQRVLVCCPLSTVLNWVDEIHKWIGPVTNQIKVFELSKLKKTYERAYQLEDWYNGGGIFIIGYELFRSLSTLDPFLDDVRPTIINKIRTALLDPGPDIIVCDEGHLLKNDCSVLAVAMSRVVTKRRIMLTGTPMQNNLREYYCMVNFVKPNLLGTYAEYSNRFENPIMNGQHRDSREEDIKLMKARTHILHKVLEGCLQRQEASVLYPYLPKKHEYTVFITLTQCQWDLYKHYLGHYAKQSKQSILRDFHILQKIWSHPQVLHNFQTKGRDDKNKVKAEKLEDDLATEDQEEIKPPTTDLWWLEYMDGGNMLETLDSSNKFVVVFRILDECVALGDKVLIFSTSLFCLDALEYFLKKINKWSLGQEYYRLDGSVPAEVRQKWCREFNADNNTKTKLFLVSTRAGCLGLNMTAANRVIIMDTSWNPAHDIQSIFRVYRFGQKKDCYIYRLVAMGTMEQKIYERSVTKQAVACRVVDEQQIDRHYNMAELTELYKFDEAGSTVAGGVAVGVHDVALLRVARLTALHAVHEHDSLLRGSSEQGLPEHERNAAWMQFQQEQAHKQIENKLSIPNVPKISLKRLHGQEYATTSTATQIKTEDTSADFVPNEPKAKKGKKNSIVTKCSIPIEDCNNSTLIKKETRGRPRKDASKPTTSKEPDDSALEWQEEAMVEKITDILLKHKFQYRTGNMEISNLITRVRNIVQKGFVNDSDMSDDLTSSIARILLPKQISIPKVTDIMCESINNSAAPHHKNADPEVITCDTPSFSEIYSHNNIDLGQRMKRKAAIAAEKSIDSLAQDIVINLDDDDWNADRDFVPVANVIQDKQNVSNKSRKKIKGKNVTPEKDDDERTISAGSSPQRIDSDVDDNVNYDTPSTSKIDEDNRLVRQDTDKRTKPKDRPRKMITRKTLVDNSDSIENNRNDFDNLINETSKSKPGNATSNSILLSDDDEPILRRTSKDNPKLKLKASVTKTYKPGPKRSKRKQLRQNNDETSDDIGLRSTEVLSDNDSPLRTSELTVTEKYTNNPEVTITEKVTQKIVKPEKPDNEEIVPLPISLLKNQNFINIVAHTYLVGNPMLDEDAATLAAQYSTLKAYKEAEQTGKDVCSGPIYDIAIKVIGKEILKKMHSVNPKAATSANDQALSVQQKEQLTATEKTKPSKKKSNLRDEMINQKLGLKQPVEEVEPNVTITSVSRTPVNNAVVPVGLIKTGSGVSASGSFSQPGVECILPDDDNVIISDEPSLVLDSSISAGPSITPTAAALPTSVATPTKPIIINHTLYKSRAMPPEVHPVRVTVGGPASSATTPQPAPPRRLPKGSRNRKTAATEPTTITGTPTNLKITSIGPIKEVTPNNDTICLDSDDEEASPFNPVPSTSSSLTPVQLEQAPVPVSLTMANAPGIKLPLPAMPNLIPANSNQPTPTAQPQTLVMRQVAGIAGTQNQFVVISADQVSALQQLHMSALQQVPISELQQVPMPTLQQMSGLQQVPMSGLQQVSMPAIKQIHVPPINTSAQPINTIQLQPTVPTSTKAKPSILSKSSMITKLSGASPVVNTSQIQPNETLTSIQNPESSKAFNQTRCRPGDILRISKTGQIEVINRNDAPDVDLTSVKQPAASQPIAPKPTSIKPPTSTSVDLTDTPEVVQPKTVSPPLIETKQNQNKTVHRKRMISSSSSSSSSRASSPENPLSILKDVVHIRAADYPTPSTSSELSKHKPASSAQGGGKSIVLRTEKCSNSNISVQHVVSSETKSPSKTSVMKLTQVPKDKVPKHIDTAAEKLMKKTPSSKPSPVLNPKPGPKSAQKPGPKPKETVSVTSLYSETLGNANVAKRREMDRKIAEEKKKAEEKRKIEEKRKAEEKKRAEDKRKAEEKKREDKRKAEEKKKVDSTNALLKGMLKDKKAPVTVDLTKIVPSGSSLLKPKTENKRRPSTVVESPVKKKRTQPMTLQDFNLDDIDDIIELE